MKTLVPLKWVAVTLRCRYLLGGVFLGTSMVGVCRDIGCVALGETLDLDLLDWMMKTPSMRSFSWEHRFGAVAG